MNQLAYKMILFIGVQVICLQIAQISHAQVSFASCCSGDDPKKDSDETKKKHEEEDAVRRHSKRLLTKIADARKRILKSHMKDETSSLTPLIFPGSLGQTRPSRPGIDMRERQERAEKIDGFILVQKSEDLNTIKESSSLTLINSSGGNTLGAARYLDESEILR